ncbi:MAG TPA: hypothetical protein VKT81_06585 [Bryobacteraceae bacterium]|nr:hypothetical protein [Bryobacteraceae bacterium]
MALILQASAFAAADPRLLRLMMPDAKVIAGLQVQQTKNSAFGEYVLSHMQVEDAGFKKFITQTGFDPRRDVTEIIMGSNWEQATPQNRWLVAARGTFNLPQIVGAAKANGGTVTDFQGSGILTYTEPGKPDAESGIAFFDGSNAVMGDLDSVKAAIQRKQSNTAASGDLLAKVQEVSAKNDFWFVTVVPISEFASAMPNPNLSGAMKGDLLAAIHQASGGIRFGETVTISGEAVTRSPKDAQALSDVFRFLASLIQLNSQENKVAGQVSTLLDNMNLKTSDNVMTMSLAIPEQQLEQLLNTMRQERRQVRKKVPQNN